MKASPADQTLTRYFIWFEMRGKQGRGGNLDIGYFKIIIFFAFKITHRIGRH